MKLSSLLDPNLIFCDIEADNKAQVIDKMLNAIMAKGPGVGVEQLKEALAEREKLSSTVMAPGIAFPHGRAEGLADFYIAIATSKNGFDVEGQKINFLCMFLVNESSSNLYLKTMASMSKLVCSAEKFKELVGIEDSDDFIESIKATDIEVEPTLRADDIMSEDVITLRPDQYLKEAADIFMDTGHSIMPVVDGDGKFLGLLRSLDLLKIGLPNYLSEMSDISFMANFEPFENLLKRESSMTIEECYVKDVKAYMDHTPIIQIAIGLIHSGDNMAPIIDANGHLKGIITISDFIIKILRA